MAKRKKTRYSRRKRLKRVFFILLSLVLLFVSIFFLLDSLVRPPLMTIAEARIRGLALRALNQAIRDYLGNGVEYDSLVHISTDSSGQITMLQANTLYMNEIANQLALRAQDNISALAMEDIEIPFGTLLNEPLIADMGPMITVSVLPVGSVTASFHSDFEAAGINQTRHRISLTLTSHVELAVPTGHVSVSVEAQVPIAESIIVGMVPESYVQWEDDGATSPLDTIPIP